MDKLISRSSWLSGRWAAWLPACKNTLNLPYETPSLRNFLDQLIFRSGIFQREGKFRTITRGFSSTNCWKPLRFHGLPPNWTPWTRNIWRIKWQTLHLPQHTEKSNHLSEKNQHKVERPGPLALWSSGVWPLEDIPDWKKLYQAMPLYGLWSSITSELLNYAQTFKLKSSAKKTPHQIPIRGYRKSPGSSSQENLLWAFSYAEGTDEKNVQNELLRSLLHFFAEFYGRA